MWKQSPEKGGLKEVNFKVTNSKEKEKYLKYQCGKQGVDGNIH